MNPIFKIKISQGKMFAYQKERYDNYLRSLENGDYEHIIRKPKSVRSLNQNAYYFGIPVKMIAEHTGNTPDKIHEFLKEKFLSEEKEILGEKIKITRSTASLNTTQFENFLDQVRAWAKDFLGFKIPKPTQIDYE